MVHNFKMCSALAGSVVNSNPMGGPEPSPLGGEGEENKTDGGKVFTAQHILELLLNHTHCT